MILNKSSKLNVFWKYEKTNLFFTGKKLVVVYIFFIISMIQTFKQKQISIGYT